MSVESPSIRRQASGSAVNPVTEAGERTKWLILVIVCLAQFMVILDATIVNVALPSIERGLKFSQQDLQWVVNGYTLMFGGFLLLGGRAGDLIGRKRIFIAGVIVFALASLLNGLAQNSDMLIGGRMLQGLGAAMISPAALSVVTTTFREGSERARALGIWSGIAAGGGAVGLLAGGILTTTLSWQWNFFVNVPIGLIALALAVRYVPESKGEVEHRSFDIAGAITVTGGLILMVFTIVKAPSFGWTSPKTLGLALASLALLGIFFFIESRSLNPLVRLRIFLIRTLATGNSIMLLVASGLFSMFFFASLYVQNILGYSALQAGLAFLPVAFGIGIGAGIAQQMVRRVGVRPLITGGLILATFGMIEMVRLPLHGSYLTDLLPALIPLAIGMGFTFVPITLLATSGVEAKDAGLSSGLFNTAQQVGGSLGLAILSTFAANRTGDILGKLHKPSHLVIKGAQLDGFHVAFAVAAILMASGIVITLAALRGRHVERIESESEPVLTAA